MNNTRNGRKRDGTAIGSRALLGMVAALVLGVVATACGGQTQGASVPPTMNAAASLAAQGQAIGEKHGCVACHSTDGRILFGPSWKGLYGSVLKFTDGTSAVADERYLRDSILNPTGKVIDGWYIAMPSQIPTSDGEVSALVEYIKSLK